MMMEWRETLRSCSACTALKLHRDGGGWMCLLGGWSIDLEGESDAVVCGFGHVCVRDRWVWI